MLESDWIMVDPVSFRPISSVKANRDNSLADAKKASPGLAHASEPQIGVRSLTNLVNLAAELSAQGPPVDHAKIAQVRQAISIGAWKVDPDALASAMLGLTRKSDT